MNEALQQLLRDPRIWRGKASPSLHGQRTGHSELDKRLPQRGWPNGALIEIISQHTGIGELSLLLPSLSNQIQCWICPPYIPYAPALSQAGVCLRDLLIVQTRLERDALWAAEQILRAGHSSHVLSWQSSSDFRSLRRLQLAAEHGQSRLFLFRPQQARNQASPAALRIFLEPGAKGLYLHILKCRGGRADSFILEWPDALAMHLPAAATAGRTASRAA